MRRKKREELSTLIFDQVVSILEDRLNPAVTRILQRIHEADDGAIRAIQQIQPAHVDLTQEMADDITAKLRGPLTLPQGMGDWAREEAKYHNVPAYHRLGYGAMAADLRWNIKSDGSIDLEILRNDGMRWWSGTFRPAGHGAELHCSDSDHLS